MGTLYLVVSLGGQRVALPAVPVESVVEIDGVTPAPLVARHVAGLFALRSRVLTVIDSLAALDLGRADRIGSMQAVIVTCDSHAYALLVDHVDDVITVAGAPAPVRATLAPGWARAARGVIEHDGQAMLLIDPAALIAGPAALAA